MSQPGDGVYERVAELFDTAGPAFFGPAGEWLAALAGPPPGAVVLDVGCGSGAVAVPVARAVGPSGTVVALDNAAAMLRRLRSEARRHGLANIRARLGEAHDPPVVAGGYDTVTAGFVLFLLDRPRAAVERYAGLLAPGGRLAATTFGPGDPRWRWLLRLHLAARVSAGRPDHARALSVADLTDMFSAAGLTGVRSSEQTFTLRFAGPREWYDWSRSHGERGMWENIPPARRQAAREFADARLAEMIRQTGVLELTVTARCTVGRRPPGRQPTHGGCDV